MRQKRPPVLPRCSLNPLFSLLPIYFIIFNVLFSLFFCARLFVLLCCNTASGLLQPPSTRRPLSAEVPLSVSALTYIPCGHQFCIWPPQHGDAWILRGGEISAGTASGPHVTQNPLRQTRKLRGSDTHTHTHTLKVHTHIRTQK